MPQAELVALSTRLYAEKAAVEKMRVAEKASKAAAKAAAKEAKKFYNQKEAEADFTLWSKMESWTFEESIALLLGKEPKKVRWVDVKRELEPVGLLLAGRPEPAPFIREYERVREIALRAQAMTGERLRPAQVLLWAIETEVTTPPQALVDQINARLRKQAELRVLQASTAVPIHAKPDATTQPAIKGQIEGGWDENRLAELKAYRAKNGTTAAAAHFGISTSRVRKLLPGEPGAPAAPSLYGVFNKPLKKRQ